MIWTLIFALVVKTKDVVRNWDIGYVDKINPDNSQPRRVIGVNGEWPIPAIEATVGDTLIINIKNSLNVMTALHTHGLFHNGTNYNDGAIGSTECGIAPGSSLTYKIPLTQSGTYWAHGHMDGQYLDGLRAPLIIHDPKDKDVLKYDEEYVISIAGILN